MSETAIVDTIPFSIVRADLDGEGAAELVAGFRVARETWRVGTLRMR